MAQPALGPWGRRRNSPLGWTTMWRSGNAFGWPKKKTRSVSPCEASTIILYSSGSTDRCFFLSLEDDFGYILDPRDLSFCGIRSYHYLRSKSWILAMILDRKKASSVDVDWGDWNHPQNGRMTIAIWQSLDVGRYHGIIMSYIWFFSTIANWKNNHL